MKLNVSLVSAGGLRNVPLHKRNSPLSCLNMTNVCNTHKCARSIALTDRNGPIETKDLVVSHQPRLITTVSEHEGR